MGIKKELSKEDKIKKEISRLKKNFADLDKNKFNTLISLMEKTAFMSVSLEELQANINKAGYKIEYKNSETQYGEKRNPDVETHISMMRNYISAIKTLSDAVPAEKRKESKLNALRSE